MYLFLCFWRITTTFLCRNFRCSIHMNIMRCLMLWYHSRDLIELCEIDVNIHTDVMVLLKSFCNIDMLVTRALSQLAVSPCVDLTSMYSWGSEFTCYDCPALTNTTNMASQNSSECVCQAGTQTINGTCQLCPAGNDSYVWSNDVLDRV